MRSLWAIIAFLVIAALALSAIYWSNPAISPAPAPSAPSAESGSASGPSGSGVQQPAASTSTVSLIDNGATLDYGVGDRFLVDLGSSQEWTVTVADQSIVRRVPNIMVIRGAQGVYTAVAVGTTTISAIGRPICQTGQACSQYAEAFHVSIAVER